MNCKNCGYNLAYEPINEDGLCRRCAQFIEMDVKSRAKIIDDSIRIILNSKNLNTVVSRYEVLVENIEALLLYENNGIPTTDPLPSVLLDEVKLIRHQALRGFLESELQKFVVKFQTSKTEKTKENVRRKSVEKILSLRMYEEISEDVDETIKLIEDYQC